MNLLLWSLHFNFSTLKIIFHVSLSCNSDIYIYTESTVLWNSLHNNQSTDQQHVRFNNTYSHVRWWPRSMEYRNENRLSVDLSKKRKKKKEREGALIRVNFPYPFQSYPSSFIYKFGAYITAVNTKWRNERPAINNPFPNTYSDTAVSQ